MPYEDMGCAHILNQDKLAKLYWGEGLSVSQIAARMALVLATMGVLKDATLAMAN